MNVYVRRKSNGRELVYSQNDWDKISPDVQAQYELSTKDNFSKAHPNSKYGNKVARVTKSVAEVPQKKSADVVADPFDETLIPAKKLSTIRDKYSIKKSEPAKRKYTKRK